jgi:nitrite reductase/ring-hydroxylating ferredoxin subunit
MTGQNRGVSPAARDRGETLPWDWYTSPEILRREERLIFGPAWHYVGPLEWVSEPGDQLPCLAGDVPLVVVRDREERLRGFVNVCRHRGSEVVRERGRRETMQCPYHAWTYGLDGVLRSAPRSEREQGFDRAELGLRPALVETWGPFVFANADLGAPPLASALGQLPALLERSGAALDALEFRERVEYEVDANWKVAVENYLECYHCPVAHRGFSDLVDVDPDRYLLEIHDGVWSQFGRRREDGPGSDACGFHLLWPALKISVYPGIANLSIGPLRPLGPERTAGTLDYFFGRSVSGAEAAELLALDDEVGREDAELVASVQRGIRSGALERGRLLLSSEQLVAAFQACVASSLA